VAHSTALAVTSLVTYTLTTEVLGRVHFVSAGDTLLGGLWAVIAAAFVYRATYEETLAAAVQRLGATLVSFALCLVYLLIAPFHPWGLALLIGLGSLVLMLIGRPGYVIVATITTAVVMVAAALSPENAWEQPILRLVDTAIGAAVGVAAAWTGLRLGSSK
jgi:uncharacterized membrane protein YccC